MTHPIHSLDYPAARQGRGADRDVAVISEHHRYDEPGRLRKPTHSDGTSRLTLFPTKRGQARDILYGIHRCTHGHSDDLPEGFELMPYAEPVAVTRMHHGKIRLPASAVVGLLAVAVFAPENRGQVIPDHYYLNWRQHIFHISDWWGWQDHFREIIRPVRSRSPSVTIDFAHWWDGWTPVR